MVQDINAGFFSGPYGSFPYSSSPGNLTNGDGTLYFSANDGVRGNELWKSDGTAAGTVLVQDIRTGPDSALATYGYSSMTNVEGTLFFSADDGIHGAELCKSDGTADGTVMVGDLNPGSPGSFPDPRIHVDGTLFFAADDGDFNLHQSQAAQLATKLDTLHPEIDIAKVYLDAFAQTNTSSGPYSGAPIAQNMPMPDSSATFSMSFLKYFLSISW